MIGSNFESNPTINLSFFHAIQNDDDHKEIAAKTTALKLKNIVVVETGGSGTAGHYRTLTDNFPKQVKNTKCFSIIAP